MKLPSYRQEYCLWLTKEDAWALRETIKPLDLPLGTCEGLCAKVYEALLRLELEGGEGINVKISTDEAMIINHYLKSGMWTGADALLVQTWMVLHEVDYAPYAILKPGAAFVLPPLKEETPRRKTRRTKLLEDQGE